MDRNKPRQGAQWQFRNAAGPPFVGRHDFRGAFHGPRPMPTHPHQGHPYRDQFNPKYNHSHDYRSRFFSPPRSGQSFHHENRYGEFTPPRPFHGLNRGGRQSSNRGIGQWGYQRPAHDTKVSLFRSLSIYPTVCI